MPSVDAQAAARGWVSSRYVAMLVGSHTFVPLPPYRPGAFPDTTPSPGGFGGWPDSALAGSVNGGFSGAPAAGATITLDWGAGGPLGRSKLIASAPSARTMPAARRPDTSRERLCPS